MKALVLIAHGSRRQASNREVIDLAGVLKQQAGDHYPLVGAGFLELAKPSIPEAIESCIRSGATYVKVVPYFLAAGRHVVDDIPSIVLPVAVQHPGVSILMAEHVGLSQFMPYLILDSAGSETRKIITPGLTHAG